MVEAEDKYSSDQRVTYASICGTSYEIFADPLLELGGCRLTLLH